MGSSRRGCVVLGISLLANGCGSDTEPAPRTSLDWRPCSDELECATLTVPNDDLASDGLTQQIALARARASKPSQRLGVLLFNLGGPGEASVDGLGGFQSYLERRAPELVARFDLVAFDARGIGRSRPALHYLEDATLDRLRALDPTPDDDDARAQADAVADEVLASAAGLDARFATHVDTESVARDMDRLREALGEESLNYFGGSYGGLLGALYATLFPTRVRAFVLDSPVMPAPDRLEILRAQAEAYERGYAAFRDSCATSTTCALQALGSDGIEQAIGDVVEDATHVPIAVGARGLTGSDILVSLASGLMVGRNAWPGVAEGLAELLDGDGSSTLATADGYWGRRNGDEGYSNDITDAYTAISSLDAPSPAGFERTTFDAFIASEVMPIGPHFGPAVALGERISVGWPFERGRPLPRVHAPLAPPLLVLGGLDDPTTPVAWAYDMRDALDNGSALVTNDDQAHGQFFASDCVRDRVVEFLVEPAGALGDAACSFEPDE